MSRDPILDLAVEQARKTPERTKEKRDYYAGLHRAPYVGSSPDPLWRELALKAKENYMGVAVDFIIDRMEMTGFAPANDQDTNTKRLAAIMWDDWEQQQMESQALDFHTSLRITGETGGVFIYPDSRGVVRYWTTEPEAFGFEYNPEDQTELDWASKTWLRRSSRDQLQDRLFTIWTADTIRTYVSERSGPTLTDASGFKLVSEAEHRFGRVPAVACKTGSTLPDLIPIQDGLNQDIAHMLLGGFFNAVPLTVLQSIVSSEIDKKTGKPKVLYQKGDQVIALSGSPAGQQEQKVYTLATDGPDKFIKSAEEKRASILRVGRLPAHVLHTGGTPPTGESLKTSEAPFIGLCKRDQRAVGHMWSDAASMKADMLALQRGLPALRANLRTTWADARSASDESNARIFQMLTSSGVSISTAGVDYLGWDAEKAEQEVAANALSKAEDAALAGSVFSAGV